MKLKNLLDTILQCRRALSGGSNSHQTLPLTTFPHKMTHLYDVNYVITTFWEIVGSVSPSLQPQLVSDHYHSLPQGAMCILATCFQTTLTLLIENHLNS